MTNHEKEKFIEIVKGMSREEHEIIAELLPVDLILKRIASEISEKERLNQMIVCMGIAVQKADPPMAGAVKMTDEVITQLNRGVENTMKPNRRETSFA